MQMYMRQKRREKYKMLDKVIENNRVTIIGEIVSDFQYSHEVFGEGFYLVMCQLTDLVIW